MHLLHINMSRKWDKKSYIFVRIVAVEEEQQTANKKKHMKKPVFSLDIFTIACRNVVIVWLQNEYLSLVEQCMNFACELMDLCRGTQEVEAVLSESNEEQGSYDPLERLKMAMEYEEKKVGQMTP